MFSKIFDLLADTPTNAVLRERIADIRAESQRLVDRVEELERKYADAMEQLAEARRQLAAQASAKEQFVKHSGVLWEREATGGYARYPVCPRCELPMNSLEGVLPFRCSQCKFLALFTGRELDRVMKELPSESSATN